MSVATAGERLPVGLDRRTRWAPALVWLLGLLALAATLEVVLDGAVEHSPLIPKQPVIAGWLSGPGERLGFRVFLIAITVATVSYGGLALLSFLKEQTISKRWAIGLIGVLHLVVFIGPVLLSTDVFRDRKSVV